MSKRNSPTVHIPWHTGGAVDVAAERCARCAAVLDPSVFHDDDHQGRPLCVTCCPTCEHERHTQPCTQFAPAPGAASAWCDHCGWHTDHHDDDPPIGRAVTRIVNPTTTTKETTP